MTPKKTVIANGRKTIYQIAAEEYGDADKFIAIMQYNDLRSPFIIAPTKVNIPDSPPNNNGKPDIPTTKDPGIQYSLKNYSFTQTTNLENDGIVTYQYNQGSIVSMTTGIGNKIQAVKNEIVLLYAVTTVIISNLLSTSATASWERAIANDFTINYSLQYRLTNDTLWITVANTDQLTFPVTDLTPNHAYDFRVIPYNSVGNSLTPPPITTIVTPIFG